MNLGRMLGNLKKYKINKLNKRNSIYKKINANGKDILESEKFINTKKHIQHGDVSVNQHCKSVAKVSLIINRFLHASGNEKDIVRGALLHDYFLYDWHCQKRQKGEIMHGFTHAGKALVNAKKDYMLNQVQQNIIGSHMWPLNITKLPRCKEAWIVTAADKYCSLMETLHIHRGNCKEKVI